MKRERELTTGRIYGCHVIKYCVLIGNVISAQFLLKTCIEATDTLSLAIFVLENKCGKEICTKVRPLIVDSPTGSIDKECADKYSTFFINRSCWGVDY